MLLDWERVGTRRGAICIVCMKLGDLHSPPWALSIFFRAVAIGTEQHLIKSVEGDRRETGY